MSNDISCWLPKIKILRQNLADLEPVWLWKAEGNGCAPIYIFGTIHRINFNPDEIFGEAIKNTIEKVDTIFTEIEISNNCVNKRSIDCWVAALARVQHKKLMPLENTEIRLSLGVSPSVLSDNIYANINADDIKKISEEYLSGKIVAKSSLGGEADTLAAIASRNIYWLLCSILDQSRNQKSCLVTVGCGHNVGELGLPNLLRGFGYILYPLIRKIPLTSHKTLRAMIHESTIFTSTSFFAKPVADKAKDEEQKSPSTEIVRFVPKH